MKELGHKALKYYARHFPVEKGKQRLVSVLWQRMTPAPRVRECVLKQADVHMTCDLTKYLQRQLYFFGGYEPASCAYWMSRATVSKTIFDVGANVGLYTLLAAAANPTAELHAFEPSPSVFDTLVDNIRLNNLQRITINAAAVGRKSGGAYLHSCMGNGGNNEGMDFVNERADGATFRTSMVSLDDYCSEKQIGRIDLLKMDIEGGEFGALVGACSLLQERAVGCIFLELIEWAAERGGSSTRQIRELLSNFGYQIYKTDGRGLRPVPNGVVQGGDNFVALPALTAGC